MTTIFSPAHPHYAVHKAYVDGCFADPANPLVVECRASDNDFWEEITRTRWNKDNQYRIKPRTITRLVTYPEPLRAAPDFGSQVWYVVSEYDGPYSTTWTDTQWLRTTLKNGMCFATEADAQACYNAIFKA